MEEVLAVLRERGLHQSDLNIAAAEGDVDAVESLLQNGVDPDGTDDVGKTAMAMAAMSGQAGVVRLLLEYGAAAETGEVGSRQPLHGAAQGGYADVVRLLPAAARHHRRCVKPELRPGKPL